MQKWLGSSGVCINEKGEVLMVLQGKPDEEKKWSIPSGGKEQYESFEQCCIREIGEETGYTVEIIEELYIKKASLKEACMEIEVHYFFVKIVGGNMNIQDPDKLIHAIEWKNKEQLEALKLSFPEDRQFLIDCISEIPADMN